MCATERARRRIVAGSARATPDPQAAKYVAALLRARWIVAQDAPLFQLEPEAAIGELQALPELRPLRLFKNSRAKLLNWCLQDADAAAVQATTAPKVVLQSVPTCLLTQVEGATWKQLPSLPAGVACIRPVQQAALEMPPVACDYAGTAYSFMGATLPACTLHFGVLGQALARRTAQCLHVSVSREAR